MSEYGPTDAPAYRQLSATTLHDLADGLAARYSECDCCPHACGIDRTANEIGRCGVGENVILASAGPHHGEEPPIRGTTGSGTIFLAGCPLSCVFCQNYRISQEVEGRSVTPTDIADIAMDLQRQGCHNVNFVTPTHVPAQLVRAIAIGRERGLHIPIVWNCGGYESVDVLERLDGIVDIYMPDLKYSDPDLGERLSDVSDYPERAYEALQEMHRQVGHLRIENGIATRGVLVRHLVLPNFIENSKGVLTFLVDHLGPETYVNLMRQYHPAFTVSGSERYADIDRRLNRSEYREVAEFGREQGLSRLQTDS